MASYRAVVKSVSYYEVYFDCEGADEAWTKAQEIDGGDYDEIKGYESWEIESVEQCDL